jgi:hypothetical protein
LKNRLLILALFVFSVTIVSSQDRLVQNQPLSDIKQLHFGFTLGLNTTDFGITNSGAVDPLGKSYYLQIPSYSTGFTVGVISDLRIFDCLNLRFVPTLNFGDRYLVFVDNARTQLPYQQDLKSTLLDFPIYLKYRAKRINNYRPYVIFGGGFVYDLSRQKEDLILLNAPDLNIEFGVGCDFYMEFFKLAPEFKLCLGTLNVLDRNRSDLLVASDIKYTNALSKLTSRMFVLTFNFE